VVTTHTLFCVRGPVDERIQLFLCGIFNSFVANYLVRMRVGTHVNVSIIEQLPVPHPDVDSAEFRDVVDLCGQLLGDPSQTGPLADLQGAVACLYELTAPEFHHVLETFPLVSEHERSAAMRCFVQRVHT